ncbi:MAG: hypothetical protein COA36_11665 [Desulfotalea sp.]|nr:MAG: hypothetical protein COA36_11665 [Desulfotalea sp.]
MNFELKEKKSEPVTGQSIILGGCEVGWIKEEEGEVTGRSYLRAAIHMNSLPGAVVNQSPIIDFIQGTGSTVEEAIADLVIKARKSFQGGFANLNLLESFLSGEKK